MPLGPQESNHYPATPQSPQRPLQYFSLLTRSSAVLDVSDPSSIRSNGAAPTRSSTDGWVHNAIVAAAAVPGHIIGRIEAAFVKEQFDRADKDLVLGK